VNVYSRRKVLRVSALGGAALAVTGTGCANGESLPFLSNHRAVAPTQTAVLPDAGLRVTPTPRPAPANLTLTGTAGQLPGRLLFVADANVWRLERGTLHQITQDRVSRQPAWSNNGSRIAMVKYWTSGSDLVVTEADGTQPQEITDFTYREDARQNYALYPIWSADGTRLYFLSQEGSEDTQLWQVTLADRRRQRLLAHGERYGGLDRPRLSPDGRTLAVASFQPGRVERGRPQIWTYTLPNGPWRQLTEVPGGAYDPEWSPDGRLAFAVRTIDPGRSVARHDIWVARPDGSGARAVTVAGTNRAPCWSPDGMWLAYLSARSGIFDIYMIAAPADPAPGTAAATSGSAASLPTVPATVPAARQITQNGALDAVSGLSWTR
jgi:Tol biopolymer transport system component